MRSSSGFFVGRGLSVGLRRGLGAVGRGRCELAVAGHDVDPVLDQVRVQLLHLLLGHVHLLEAARDLLEGQIAALAPLRKQVAQFLDIPERRVGLLGQ